MNKEAQYKKAYLERAKEAGKTDNADDTPKYSFAMLQALRDMAEHDVYPDGHFSDEECNVWSMFHTSYAKK